MSDQLVESVPMEEGRDERMDTVITPDGPLAFTSAEERERAAAGEIIARYARRYARRFAENARRARGEGRAAREKDYAA